LNNLIPQEEKKMRNFTAIHPQEATHIAEPPIAKFLFADSRMAWLWLIVRLYVGYEWLTAGLEKLTGYSYTFDAFNQKVGSPWVFGAHDGAAIKGFVSGALAQVGGPHPAVQGWYASFLQSFVLPNAAVFAYLVTFGEVLIGLALVFGALTGVAAFFGVFMNLNFLLAGAVSINPVIGTLAMFLVLAWRIGGYYGIDRWLLPLLGTPWTGTLAKKNKPEGNKKMVDAGAATS
jgi:thiosulfate dehydrogenase [quinone] large subunit